MAAVDTRSSASPSPDIPDKIVVDYHGDLHLHIGLEQHDVLVCSNAMRRASMVWKTMFFGRFTESKPAAPGEEWVVKLPEDRKEPMLTVLYIIHGRFDMVPREPSASELYQILAVTEKYDMTGLARPWARQWIDAVQQTTRPVLAWIAWELGDAAIFVQAVETLARTCSLDEDGQLVTDKGVALSHSKYDALRPTDLIEHVAETRAQILDCMLFPLQKLHKDLKKANSKCCEACAFTNLGSFLISTARCGLDPLPACADDYPGSIVKLEEQFALIKVMSPHIGPNVINPVPAMRNLAKMAVENRRRETPEMYLEHMKNQRKKTGIVCNLDL